SRTAGNTSFSTGPPRRAVQKHPNKGGGKANSVGRGVDRDRAVDESGNQIAVFGRVGARPLKVEEQRRLFLRNGRVWRVSDDPGDQDCYPEPRPWVANGEGRGKK